MQQESGYVGAAFRSAKMAAGAEAFLEDAGCWQASLQNARELLEAALERENVHALVGLADVWTVLVPRAWLAPGSPEEGRRHDAATREGRTLTPLAVAHVTSLMKFET